MDLTGCLRLLCPRLHQVRELLPLTTSHKLQPTDIMLFSYLKMLDSLCNELGYCYNNSHVRKLG